MAKLYVITPPEYTEAQEALREAFEAFSSPELGGFIMLAWDKGEDPVLCLHSPDKGLDELSAALNLNIQTLHTITALTQEGIIRDIDEEG